jgi:uncharacterized protein YaiL (DUF2058 family)
MEREQVGSRETYLGRRSSKMTTSEFSLSGSSHSLRYPEWSHKYREALLETDREKLSERVVEAEAAIFERLQQLSQSQDGQAERKAIQDAINALRFIKRDRLAFPDWESSSSGA